jgi:Rod binding domain-containing protein
MRVRGQDSSLRGPLEFPLATDGEQARLEQLRRSLGRDPAQAAKQFETVFATLLVRELRRSMPERVFGQGPGSDVYEGWFDEHLGNALAERDALGIAGMVKAALARAQDARAATETEPEEPR